jgi:hypothetical protein
VYIKHFCNTGSIIPHIQDIEVINTPRNSVSNLKKIEETAMKKMKVVVS